MMKAVMYGATGGGDLVELSETPFEKELHLQEFLTKHPELLAGDQMNPSDPRRFVLVTAEAGIAIADGAGDYFSLDHLFIDQDGIPTLVEVKRSSDTRSRREVIGQLLEYAANACAFWDVVRLRSTFERRCEKHRLSPEVELAKLRLAPEVIAGNIWELVRNNLKQERLRLIFLADKFAPETQRIIEFLNRQMHATEVYAVEVRQFTGGGMKTLVPRVLNPSVMQLDRKAAAAGLGEVWTSERFYQALGERCGPDAVATLRKIHAWAEGKTHVTIFFGRGRSDGSIQIAFKGGDDPSLPQPDDVTILSLWSFGRVEINFEYLMTHNPFTSRAKREELARRIAQDSDLRVSEDKINKRPSLQWKELSADSNLNALLTAIEWVVDELNDAAV